jgi:hypothetical protein
VSTENIINSDGGGQGEYNPLTNILTLMFQTKSGGTISYQYAGGAAVAIYNGADPRGYSYVQKSGGGAPKPHVEHPRHGTHGSFGKFVTQAANAAAKVAEAAL